MPALLWTAKEDNPQIHFPKLFLQLIAQNNSIFTFLPNGQFQFNVQKSDMRNINICLPFKHPFFQE